MNAQELRPELLYLIVYGPAEGEAIALRIPPSTWVLVDGCLIHGQSPTAELLRQAGAAWSCIVLTHPHLDHVLGLDSVLEMDGCGLVGCSDPRVVDDDQWIDSPDGVNQSKKGAVEQVLSAIWSRWRNDDSSRWHMRRGDLREVGGAKLEVLHPDDSVAGSVDPALYPNRFSSPLLIEWQGVRLLLGADVENADWTSIMGEYPDLANHVSMKIPHHGSKGSYGSGYWTGRRDRHWVVTPFRLGRHMLPRFEDQDGVSLWLREVDELHLTSLPSAHDLEGQVPFHATRQDLKDGIRPRRVEGRLRNLELRAPHTGSAACTDTCFVAAGFDDRGILCDLRHGTGSLIVTEGTPSPASSSASCHEPPTSPG